jgi:hypothetical protein
MSNCWFERRLWNTIFEPSGDQSGQQSSSTASVSRRTFVPFALITYRSGLKLAFMNAIWEPSGDQAGMRSPPRVVVSC